MLSKKLSFMQPLLRLVGGEKAARTPRRSPRLPVKVSAQVRLSNGQSTLPVVLNNISAGGASMLTKTRLRHDELVTLALQLGTEVKLDLRARVVHAGQTEHGLQFRYGLRFVGLSERDYERLTTFIHDPKNGWQFDAPPPPYQPEPA
jgi:c-di-GMP-binding flagellar brake protein YcgR